jgi:hypothetical protein
MATDGLHERVSILIVPQIYIELPLTRRQRQRSSLLRGRLQRTLVRGEGRLGTALTLNLIRQEDCNLRITVSTLPR